MSSPYVQALNEVRSSNEKNWDDKMAALTAAATVRCVLIDPMNKCAEFVNLPFQVVQDETYVEVKVSYAQMKQTLSCPGKCTLDRMGTDGFGHLVVWNDLERMGDEKSTIPGFHLGKGTTIHGPALVYNMTTVLNRPEHTVSAVQEASEDDLTRIRNALMWLDPHQVYDLQMEEYLERDAAIQEMKQRGELNDVQIIHLRPRNS